jgi:uncharacterized protein (TIGR02266 family)
LVDPNTRQAKRTPVTLKIKFKSATLEQFIERYAVDVSHGGIFIRTKEPLPVGTQMRFEFQLRDATPLITGEGTVVWTRENDPARPGVAPGMGVRFDRLGDGSQEVLDKILAQKAKSPAPPVDTKPPAFNEVPTRVAPSPLVGALAAESRPKMGSMAPPRSGFPDERTDATPLPKPMPFHSDVDDFPEEAFEEATKVRSLDELIAQTALAEGAFAAASKKATSPAVTNTIPGRAPAPSAPPPTAPSAPSAPVATAAAASGPVTAPASAPSAERPLVPPIAPPPPSVPSTPVAPAVPVPTVADELAVRRAAKSASDPVPAPKEARAEARATKNRHDSRPDLKTKHPSTTRISTPLPLPELPKDPTDRAPVPEPSRTPIGIIAALVMVAAAAAAVWFFVLRPKETEKLAQPGAPAGSAAEPAVLPGQPSQVGNDLAAAAAGGLPDAAVVADAAPAVVAETVEVTIQSRTKGASISIDGTDQAGAAPLVARLEKGKTYMAKVTAPGHQPSEVQVSADKKRFDVTLSPLAQVVRITSTPAGAHIYVDGRDTKKNTPADVVLSAGESQRNRVMIGLRKPGFEKLNEWLAKSAFGEAEGKLIAQFEGRLEVARARPTPTPAPDGDGPATTPGGGTTPTPTPTPAPSTEPSTPTVQPTPKPEPAPVAPTPPEPKPEPAKPAEPKPTGEPTPDWMKQP